MERRDIADTKESVERLDIVVKLIGNRAEVELITLGLLALKGQTLLNIATGHGGDNERIIERIDALHEQIIYPRFIP